MKDYKAKILIVDDEPDILEFLEYNLKREDFDVVKATNGKEGIKVATLENPDIILLDIMMPEMDGIETCKVLRESGRFDDTMIAFLTARSEDAVQISSLDLGGDDFITKPIKNKVLISRIKALLRRSQKYVSATSEPEVIEVGGLSLDESQYTLQQGEETIDLPRKEFALLKLLMSKPGKVFRREEIFSAVWGSDVIVGDRTIDVHIRKLREKIGNDLIKTVKGVGYKFES